jgi:hypothetical protein
VPVTEFVPADFAVPTELVCDEFRLTPLGPEHNDADYTAWTSSIDHIRATPGFPDRSWPVPMTKEDNLRDLERHREDFRARRGFTYTVLDRQGEVIGCVYIYPPHGDCPVQRRARVKSWVRADRALLDPVLFHIISLARRMEKMVVDLLEAVNG